AIRMPIRQLRMAWPSRWPRSDRARTRGRRARSTAECQGVELTRSSALTNLLAAPGTLRGPCQKSSVQKGETARRGRTRCLRSAQNEGPSISESLGAVDLFGPRLGPLRSNISQLFLT